MLESLSTLIALNEEFSHHLDVEGNKPYPAPAYVHTQEEKKEARASDKGKAAVTLV